MVHEKNNFDFLRISAAFLVLFSHQFSLTGHPEPAVLGYQTLGGLALNIFFTLSGYLVTQSWVNDPHLLRFVLRRWLRIWPGLAVMVLVVLLIVGPALTFMSPKDYFSDPLTLAYLQVLRLSMVYRLPGVFVSNPLPFVNGSLWTLPVEVRWYLYLAIFGIFGLIRFRYLLLAVLVGMAFNYFFLYGFEQVASRGGDRWWNTELGIFFLSGSCLYLFREFVARQVVSITIALVVAAAALILGHFGFAAATVVMPFVIIQFGIRSFPLIRHAGRWGDPSYGVYIYAFVIQQSIVSITHNGLSFFEGLVSAAALAALAGYASWHGVEKPALRFKMTMHRPGNEARAGQ